MTDNERNHLSGKALEAYDRMLEQVQSRLRTMQDTTLETLEGEVDNAIEAEQDLKEMTKDEISLLGTYLQRDLEHLIHFVDETGEGLAEWLQLDMSLLEQRLTERLLSVADREVLLGAISKLLPPQRPMMLRIWHEVNLQCANYVRGKALEILIVGGATYIALKLMGVPYAALLSLLVGLSVVIPYIGAAVVTIPVAVIALFAFGWGSHFIWVMVIYGIIQALDGNVLVPVLFSEVNNLHPVVISSQHSG